MTSTNRARYLKFVSTMLNVAADFSAEELVQFRRMAASKMPGAVTLVDGLTNLTEHLGDTSATIPKRSLRDFLMSKDHFPKNRDLIAVATRVMPDLPDRRWDKMSREKVVMNILAQIESMNAGRREKLEHALRKAPMTSSGKDSFFADWEKIVKR